MLFALVVLAGWRLDSHAASITGELAQLRADRESSERRYREHAAELERHRQAIERIEQVAEWAAAMRMHTAAMDAWVDDHCQSVRPRVP